MQRVGADDEWVAEAYMKTDYSKLDKSDFEKVLFDYALFTVGSSIDDVSDEVGE
ncbi:hypothetical protein [Glutamicibacter arilaitensis]